MIEKFKKELSQLLVFRWRPGKELLVVLGSWALVIAALYTATMFVGSTTGGGIPYFLIYAVFAATVCGVGIPIGWMVLVRKRPLADLGITSRWLGLSLVLQVVFTLIVVPGGLSGMKVPAIEKLIPLLGLALSIGFFEAVFWRGWVLNRLEEAFGFIPAALIGSALYAAYHIGYGMPLSEMVFLFFIGLMYAVVFRFTRSVFILWPLFQPSGQLITLLKDGLDLPLAATIGFAEVLVVMGVLVWLAGRRWKKMTASSRQAPDRLSSSRV